MRKTALFPVIMVAALAAQNVHAQSVGTTGNVPGGLTLVPGTVVTPNVGGSAATGTVPLAGLPGSPGVRNFDPQLAPPTGLNSGSQYRVAPYPSIAPPFTNQSTLPQNLERAPGITEPVNPSPPAFCPSGALSTNGLC